ncbi:MAG: hypothetical protein UHX00_13305 [Caryophanon sp.]|nr:hypothetical protein [Caryophanon sp.]
MHKTRFGIDIDGTVTCPSTLIPHINKQYNVNLTLDDITEYDFTCALNIDKEAFNTWFKQYEPDMYRASELAAGAKDVLTSWFPQAELHYISARGENVAELTFEWFKQHAIPFHHITCIGKHDKLAVAKERQVEAFFEDKHDNAVMLAEELDIPVILFDTPYNRLHVPNNVIRVADWQQAQQWINAHFQLR